MIRTKFSLFLAFYIDNIFKTLTPITQSQALEKILTFLLVSLKFDKKKNDKVLAIQCLDTLTT